MNNRTHLIDILQTLVQLKNISQDISDKILFYADAMVDESKLTPKDIEPNIKNESRGWYQTISSTPATFVSDPTEMSKYAFD